MIVLILGANSDMAHAVARKFAEAEKARIILASRDVERLQTAVEDLKARYNVEAEALAFDATDYDSHKAFYEGINPKPDGVVVAFGMLGQQAKAQADFAHARNIIETNYLGAVSILEVVAADFEQRRHGFIIGFSSVAGLRGRQSNYMYGSAKGALTTYLSGLRHRLFKANVKVLTVLPGFVATKMTEGMNLPEKLTATPAQVAEDVYKGYKKGAGTIYTRWFWRYIMLIITHLPEFVFKRTKL